jgi:hypothetical protein
MRITSFAPSMTQPTYAVSSAPQGTFGASTPVVRSVAPAATETQRSGGVPTSRQFLAGATALLTSVSLVGCGERTAKLAESLGAKVAKPAETSLASISTHNAGLNSLKSFVPNPIATGLEADLIATVPGSLAPNAGGTVTGGVSTVVDQGVNGSLHSPLPPCKFGDKIPPNVDTNDATSVDWSVIGVPGRQDCIARWKTTNPGSPQLSALDYKVNGIEAGTVVATNPSTDEPCRKAEGWIALTKSEVAKREERGVPLSPNAEEKAGAGFDYERLLRSDIVQWGKALVCPLVEPYLPEPSLKNIPEAVTGAGRAYNRRAEELEIRSNN